MKNNQKANVFGLGIIISMVVGFIALLIIAALYFQKPKYITVKSNVYGINTSDYKIGDTLYINASGGFSTKRQYFAQQWHGIIIKGDKIKVKSLIK